jgi:acetyl-CoA carboxylase carboxyl transferase subunit alpha
MLAAGLIDGIIEEPLGGAHRNPEAIIQKVKDFILTETEALQKLEPILLKRQRIEKFSKMGVYERLANPS